MKLQRGDIEALEGLRDALPYPGLRPFLPEEARYFMGREIQIREIIARLARENCVTVLGGSGCGKSSIVRAGVIPALRLKLIPGRGDFWRIAMCTPGRAPMDNLVAALEDVLVPGSSAERSGRIREVLYGPRALGGFLPTFKNEIDMEPSLSADVLERANVLIVIDQFEELFREENRGQAQAAALAELVIDCWRRRDQNSGLFLVLTMRTDDLHRCAEFIDLPDVINATGYLTRRLKEDELREAIVAPVRPPMFRAGLLAGAPAVGEADLRPYEVQVVTEILDAVEEIAYDPDHLPLFQHLLTILWRTALERWRRDQGSGEAEPRITEEDLARALGFDAWSDLVKAREKAYAANSRGWLLRHCLEHVADELYQGGLFGAPLTTAQREIARTAFCLMGDVDDRGNFKRRWTTREEIARVAGLPTVGPDIDAFIRRFTRDHRLLWVRESGDMDVSHESLMRNWSRLTRWLTDNRAAGEAYRRLAECYVTWRRASRTRFQWLSWFRRRRNGFLGEDDLERIQPLLARQHSRFQPVEPRCNRFWAERFVSPNNLMPATPLAGQTAFGESLRDIAFDDCFDYLKKSRRRNLFRQHLPVASVASAAVLIGVIAPWMILIRFESAVTTMYSQILTFTILMVGLLGYGAWPSSDESETGRLYIWQDSARLTYQLETGEQYEFWGLCDDNCKNINLALYDSNNNLIAEEPHDTTVLKVDITQGGTFYLEVSIPDCWAIGCIYGVVVLKAPEDDSQSAPEEGGIPLPPPPRPEAPPRRAPTPGGLY